MKLLASFVFLAATLGRAQDYDLTNSPPRAREMSVALFNQRDFSGWTFYMKDGADPKQTWIVTNGVIRCTGKA